MKWLGRSEWEKRAEAHTDRLRPYVEPHSARRLRGEKHRIGCSQEHNA